MFNLFYGSTVERPFQQFGSEIHAKSDGIVQEIFKN